VKEICVTIKVALTDEGKYSMKVVMPERETEFENEDEKKKYNREYGFIGFMSEAYPWWLSKIRDQHDWKDKEIKIEKRV